MFSNLSKRGKILLVVIIAGFVGLIAFALFINQRNSGLPINQLRQAMGIQNRSELDIGEIVIEQNGWGYATTTSRRGRETPSVVYRYDEAGNITVASSGTSYDVPTLTDLGVPAEIQAAILGVSVQIVEARIEVYNTSGSGITFSGFDILVNRGLSRANTDLVQNLVRGFFTSRQTELANQVQPQSVILSGVQVDETGDSTGLFVYRGDILVDGQVQYRIDIRLSLTILVDGVELVASDSGNTTVLFGQ